MKKLLFLYVLCIANQVNAQVDLQPQINNLSQSLPSYFYAYSEIVQTNLAAPMMLCNQIQHTDEEWRIKYSFAFAGVPLSTDESQNNVLNINSLASSYTTQFSGSFSNVFGKKDKTFIQQFIVNEEGERIVNPITGEYISIKAELLGGLNRRSALVPAFSPFLEFRIWKGLIVSAAYFPIGYLLKDFESKNFDPKINYYAGGLSVHLNYFTDLPVLKWLRIEGNYNLFDLQLNHIEESINFLSSDFYNINFDEITLKNQYIGLQFRSSLAIPISKNFYLITQYSLLNYSQKFEYNYNFNLAFDKESLQDDLNLEIKDESFLVKDTYQRNSKESFKNQLSAGFMYSGTVGTFLFNYTNYPINTFSAKVSIKII